VHGIEAPFFVFLTLTDVRGVSLYLRHPYSLDYSPARYHRDQLTLPEVVITADQLDRQAHLLFQPLFDTLANAFGLPKSFNYTPDGTYQAR
jgi:hypothetical protein